VNMMRLKDAHLCLRRVRNLPGEQPIHLRVEYMRP
jgi:hypothetical protein